MSKLGGEPSLLQGREMKKYVASLVYHCFAKQNKRMCSQVAKQSYVYLVRARTDVQLPFSVRL